MASRLLILAGSILMLYSAYQWFIADWRAWPWVAIAACVMAAGVVKKGGDGGEG